MEVEYSYVSIIGFFVIVFILGYLLHRVLTKTGIYKRKIKGKGWVSKLLYIGSLILLLYILLLVIFGVIKLISF
ncbi:MAG: hypothetical protein ACI9Y7_000943 [Dokdonia sp.]|jgi:hypothetical protein